MDTSKMKQTLTVKPPAKRPGGLKDQGSMSVPATLNMASNASRVGFKGSPPGLSGKDGFAGNPRTCNTKPAR